VTVSEECVTEYESDDALLEGRAGTSIRLV
jgi:hypothetical protein